MDNKTNIDLELNLIELEAQAKAYDKYAEELEERAKAQAEWNIFFASPLFQYMKDV